MKRLSIAIISSIMLLLSCSSGEKTSFKPFAMYLDKNEYKAGDSVKIYYNTKHLRLSKEEALASKCQLFFSSSDEYTLKEYVIPINKVENNDSMLISRFVVPSGVNKLNVLLFTEDPSKMTGLESNLDKSGTKYHFCENSGDVRRLRTVEEILAYDAKERANFPFNHHYKLYAFMLNRGKEEMRDTVLKYLNAIIADTEKNPPTSLEDKMDLYSFMAMSYSMIGSKDEAIEYLKKLQGEEFKNCTLANSAAIVNLKIIPAFFSQRPDLERMPPKTIDIVKELINVAYHTDSKPLFSALNKFVNGMFGFFQDDEFENRILDYLFSNLEKALKNNDTYYLAQLSELQRIDANPIYRDRQANIKEGLLKFYKDQYYSTRISKDTNDYVIGVSNELYEGRLISQYANLCIHYANKKAYDKAKAHFNEAEKIFSTVNSCHIDLMQLSLILVDVYIDEGKLDSASIFIEKAIQYEYYESPMFDKKLEALNKARKAKSMEALSLKDILSRKVPSIRNIDDLGEIPSELSFIKSVADTTIFFINFDDNCKVVCNTVGMDLASIINKKIDNKEKIKFYFISNLSDKDIKQIFNEKFTKIPRNSNVSKYLGFKDSKYSDLIILKEKRLKYYATYPASEEFIKVKSKR